MELVAVATKGHLRTDLPSLKAGQTVRVHQNIKEGDKERTQVYEGMIIAVKHGKGVGGTITVRKVSDGVGVEKIFPLHSPMIAKIEVLKEARVRRAKLFYVRRDVKKRKFTETKIEGEVKGKKEKTPKPVAEEEGEE